LSTATAAKSRGSCGQRYYSIVPSPPYISSTSFVSIAPSTTHPYTLTHPTHTPLALHSHPTHTPLTLHPHTHTSPTLHPHSTHTSPTLHPHFTHTPPPLQVHEWMGDEQAANVLLFRMVCVGTVSAAGLWAMVFSSGSVYQILFHSTYSSVGDSQVSRLQVQYLAQIHTFTDLCLSLSTLGSHPPGHPLLVGSGRRVSSIV
jgi:hypothetical protein